MSDEKLLIEDPKAHALLLADMIIKASEGYEVGTVRAHREQWAVVIAALLAYAVTEVERKWRRVNGDELPDGTPVAPGTTLYAFDVLAGGHWEYDLPALPYVESPQQDKT